MSKTTQSSVCFINFKLPVTLIISLNDTKRKLLTDLGDNRIKGLLHPTLKVVVINLEAVLLVSAEFILMA